MSCVIPIPIDIKLAVIDKIDVYIFRCSLNEKYKSLNYNPD
ncbi:conserved hypothetical protein [Vibrio chagasii]|nr:conserved hypothetical protein [Vibrio chagasii]CAH6796954.1 conserved hypothetical protein [Vibrio chagasii]CAH6797003.1 conserved hypothetical protein [Vibrio chagasii]CAH6805926.1 conserved hypothetical protein [Vibrio chagasii]CAH6806295.1 conserved hypothetical protein [Vibrio chagasii]